MTMVVKKKFKICLFGAFEVILHTTAHKHNFNCTIFSPMISMFFLLSVKKNFSSQDFEN